MKEDDSWNVWGGLLLTRVFMAYIKHLDANVYEDPTLIKNANNYIFCITRTAAADVSTALLSEYRSAQYVVSKNSGREVEFCSLWFWRGFFRLGRFEKT